MHPAARHRGCLLATALAVVGLFTAPTALGDDYFMRLSGGTPQIFGESTVKGYEKWIELDSAAWGVTADSSWTKGGGASVGKPAPGDLLWTQSLDTSVPAMLSHILSGKSVPLATVELVKDGAAGPVTFMQLAMTDLFFTGLSFDGTGAAGSAVFKTLTQTIWPLQADGSRGKPVAVSWNVTTGAVVNSGDLAGPVAGFGPGNLSPAPVPEPGTYALMLAGLLAVGFVAHRRRAGRSTSR